MKRLDTKHIGSFDRDASIALKGVAIILMMFHHCFREKALFEKYTISFFPFPEDMVVHMAYTGKICVSVFAFITGYGLYLSYTSRRQNPTRWAAKRWLNTFSRYWFVWVLSAVACELIDHRTSRLLSGKNVYQGLCNTVIDFLGLATLFKTPTINGSWWYMSAVFIFILIIPFICRHKEHLWLVLLWEIVFLRVISGKNGSEVFPGRSTPYSFLTPLIIGCIFARYQVFDRWTAIGKNRPLLKAGKLALELAVLLLFYKMYFNLPITSFWEVHYGLYPTVFILICVEYVIPIPILRPVLKFFGRHSTNIYLIHTFIRTTYLADLTYSFPHFAMVPVFLLVASLMLSLLIERLKVLTRFPRLVQWAEEKLG